MAIYCEAISVVVRKSTIVEKLHMQPYQLRARFPGGSYWEDENIVRFGFMAPQDAGLWIDALEDLGLTFVDEGPIDTVAIDIVVVDQLKGPTCTCPWIQSEIIDGYRWAWENGQTPGEHIGPPDMEERNFTFIPQEVADGMAIMTEEIGTSDQTIDNETGKTTYIGRVFGHLQAYDALIRRAITELQVDNAAESYFHFREAERIKALNIEHRVFAAQATYETWRMTGNPELLEESYARLVEITELGPGENVKNCWLNRAVIERQLQLNDEAQKSDERAQSCSE
jgi:hypothetical protein